VAIDAEFVQLAIDEKEVQEEEEKRVVATPAFSVARVSALYGELNSTLIDDYIATRETVADYLTRFSGIVHGDLDPAVSPHHITTLKSMIRLHLFIINTSNDTFFFLIDSVDYLKLRHLIDRGVIFVGHGLNKDFRIISKC